MIAARKPAGTGTRHRAVRTLAACLASVALHFLVAAPAVAQDLEPRAYANTPVGMHFLVLNYSFSRGGVSADPAVPLEDAEIDIHLATLGYARTFALFGQSAKVGLVLPWAEVSGSAVFAGTPVSRDFSGQADPIVKLSTNLLGAPALDLEDFLAWHQEWIVGASLSVSLPLGRYDAERLVNIGTNRWAVKPELGVSRRWGPLTVDAAASAKFYSDNDEFLVDRERSQAPLFAIQGHAIYSFGKGTWVSFDATWYGGGRTEIDGVRSNDRQSNARVGATLVQPLSRHLSVQVYASTGVAERTGSDFDTAGVGLSYRWGGGL